MAEDHLTLVTTGQNRCGEEFFPNRERGLPIDVNAIRVVFYRKVGVSGATRRKGKLESPGDKIIPYHKFIDP